MEGLSINNLITNEDIIITYAPSVINYSYVIIKDIEDIFKNFK